MTDDITYCQPVPDDVPGSTPPVTVCPGNGPSDYPDHHVSYAWRLDHSGSLALNTRGSGYD